MPKASDMPPEIPVRKHVRFDFSETPVVHTAGNAHISHFWNALSAMAPSTERILILVARSVRDEIRDDRLRADLDALVAQEGLHTREHRRLNRRLGELGCDIEDINERMDRALDAYVARVGKRASVALMIAGEHIIYEISRALLRDPRVLVGMDPTVEALLKWHAAEEMEHQSVAHDVYVHLYGDGPRHWWIRTRAFLDAAGILAGAGQNIMARLLQSAPPTTAAEKRDFIRFLTLYPAYGVRVATRSLRYFAPGFAPRRDTADEALIRLGLQSL